MPKHSAARHIFLLASALALMGQTAPTRPASTTPSSTVLPPSPQYRSPSGISLNYAVEWRLFDAGVATFRIDSAGREQRVVATADARGVVGLLYHVHDRFETFYDPTTNCSRSIEKRTEEGFRRLETNITFDAARGKSLLREKNLKSNESKSVENDSPSCVKDVASAAFYIASQPLAPGNTLLFPLNDGGKTVDVKATVEAREEIRVPAGTYKTIRVQAISATAAAKSKGQVWIWYTDDDRHTPVQMKARMFWGSLTFRLK